MEHLSDESKDHKLMLILEKKISNMTYPRFQKHATKICELHCKQCTFLIHASCVTSGDHDQHQKVDILVNWRYQQKKKMKKI
mgnify:CR=1 FL=1